MKSATKALLRAEELKMRAEICYVNNRSIYIRDYQIRHNSVPAFTVDQLFYGGNI